MHLISPHYVFIRQRPSFRISNHSKDTLMRVIVIWDVQLHLHQHDYREWAKQ